MNLLTTYYGINIEDINIKLDLISFSHNSIDYVLIHKDNIDIELLNYLFYYVNIINKPILNKYNSYVTEFENKYYFLFYDKLGNVTIKDIHTFLNQRLIISDNKLHTRWCNKIDYHEYQITQFGTKYLLLRESINYVVGLSEIGIQLLNTIDLNNCFSCLTHNRLNNLFDYTNPLNICMDYRIRDVSEYIKYMFFYENKEIFDEIVLSLNLTKDEYKLLFARLLIITPYYDMYEKIIDEKIKENEIKKIINKFNDYEMFLKKIYLYLKRYIDIDNIELFNN